MRLDKIMIWISIHLHSLPGDTSSVAPSRSLLLPFSSLPLATIPSTIPFHVSQSYARYHMNALLVPSALVSSPSKRDAAGRVSSTTSSQNLLAVWLLHTLSSMFVLHVYTMHVYWYRTVYRAGQSGGGDGDGDGGVEAVEEQKRLAGGEQQ